MDNFLKGLQYRERAGEFPSWRTETYGPWMEVTDSDRVYNSYTEFRPRPKYKYTVAIGLIQTGNLTLDAAMAKVAEEAKAGRSASIAAGAVVSVANLKDRKIQYRALGASQWQNLDVTSGMHFTHAVRFRIRPDFYYELTTTTSTFTFDALEELQAAINNQLNFSQFDFSVKKVVYE